jgi:hypothetical protein
MAEKIDFSDIDKILSSQEDTSNSSQESTSKPNKAISKNDLEKPIGNIQRVQALFDEGKGKYVVVPAVAGISGLYLKQRYDKKVLESMKELAKFRGEERNLIKLAESNRTGLGIASGSSAVKGVPIDKLKYLNMNGKPLSAISSSEIANYAKSEGLAKTAIPFFGSSVKGSKPAVLAENAEFPDTFTKYVLKDGKYVVEAGKPVSEVLGALGKYGKYIDRGLYGLAGLANIPKALNTGNIYNYYTEDLKRGIDPNGYTRYLGMDIPNSALINYGAPIGGGMKTLQNLGEISLDVASKGSLGFLKDWVINPALQHNFKLTEDQEKIKTKLIEEYKAKGLNPIQAERFAKNYLIEQGSSSQISDEEYKKQNYGVSRKDQQAVSDSLSNFVLSTLNAEIPPE